jgi:ABC-type transporter Mla MlaB component
MSNVLKVPDQLALSDLPGFIERSGVLKQSFSEVDCTELEVADSGFLALIVMSSVALDAPVKVKAMPESLKKLVSLYNLENYIELRE